MFPTITENFCKTISIYGAWDKDPRVGKGRSSYELHGNQQLAKLGIPPVGLKMLWNSEVGFHRTGNHLGLTTRRNTEPDLTSLKEHYAKYYMCVIDPIEEEYDEDNFFSRPPGLTRMEHINGNVTYKLLYNYNEDEWIYDKLSKVLDYVNGKRK